MSLTPYRATARMYWRLGWSPLPLPAREKSPPPDRRVAAEKREYTGERGHPVEEADLKVWLGGRGVARAGNLAYPPGNVALRMPHDMPDSAGELWDVIGLDIDAYPGKDGAETLRKAEEAYGELPPTWSSASRVGSPSAGIRYFLVPAGLAWPGDLRSRFGGGIELIRWDHRYAVVAPSENPDADGAVYFWRMPDGTVVDLRFLCEDDPLGEQAEDSVAVEGGELELPDPNPDAAELARLPEAWVAGLTGGGARVGSDWDGVELSELEVKAWLKTREGSGICPGLDRVLAHWLKAVRKAGDDGGAHEAARDGVWALVGDAAAGHSGVGAGLRKLRTAFLEAVKGRRTPRVAAAEWKRAVVRAVSRVAAEGAQLGADPCGQVRGGSSGSGGGAGGGGGSEAGAGYGGLEAVGAGLPWDDRGNAVRLARHIGEDNVKWCGPLGGWFLWDPEVGLWRLDEEGIDVQAAAIETVSAMEQEAQALSDVKLKIAYMRHVRASGGVGAMASAGRVMRSLRGMVVRAGSWDSQERLVHCPNGTLVLKTSYDPEAELDNGEVRGIEWRPSAREDYGTLTTGTRYDPEASSELWNKFLERFLPDPDVRAWVQKLAAYSLFGGNPARVLILAKGKTSTGKTTFAEALRAAFGEYAGPFGLSLFRDNQDERPRVDIIQALPRRAIFAEETSSAWHLHADQIKRATGGGVWSARGIYGKAYVERVPAFTPWIATNNTPTIEGADAALRRRLRVVPFLVQVETGEEDVNFKSKLMATGAREAILAWVVQGWAAYLDDETLTDIPLAALRAAMEVSNELSAMDECLAEICDFGPDLWARSVDLHTAYVHWNEQNGSPKEELSLTAFGRMLGTKGFERDTINDPHKGGKGHKTKVRRGLSLKEEWARLAGVTGE